MGKIKQIHIFGGFIILSILIFLYFGIHLSNSISNLIYNTDGMASSTSGIGDLVRMIFYSFIGIILGLFCGSISILLVLILKNFFKLNISLGKVVGLTAFTIICSITISFYTYNFVFNKEKNKIEIYAQIMQPGIKLNNLQLSLGDMEYIKNLRGKSDKNPIKLGNEELYVNKGIGSRSIELTDGKSPLKFEYRINEEYPYINAFSFSVNAINNVDYLFVYLYLRPTSNRNLLLIINQSADIVYEELIEL